MKNLGTKRIETKRLILRRFELTDADAMYQNWASDDKVTKFLTWPTHKDIEISRKVIEMWVSDYSEDKNYQWCIELKSIGEAIGSIGVVDYKENIEAVEIGYCIGSKYWGQGITTEALKALIEFFFEEVGVNRIEARHDPANGNSGKVMQKCGLKYEGTRIKADRNNSGICDVAMYGIINPRL
ncbi:GNAT family N-acetyltransferase [Clostridium sp. YIM B02515]|uniref:GNAT family N-acetyltransferase n=1 Tax=Clostridium rhizosphaerae TaxID=2803861 RepID=A0ABS1T483_9CLOT|nr:GNAT family N-acetyltransferase [Clostridium rhizosphaerae]MBL4934142.1 GNAT family N-acetyltransferase [Clostridium rhizosphaerae]